MSSLDILSLATLLFEDEFRLDAKKTKETISTTEPSTAKGFGGKAKNKFDPTQPRGKNGEWIQSAGWKSSLAARVQQVKANAPSITKEGIIAGSGAAASLFGSKFGIIGAIAAEGTATVIARNVTEVTSVALTQRQNLLHNESYQKASRLGKLKQIGAKTISEIRTPEFQQKLGDAMAGDLAGFTGGSLSGNTLGNTMNSVIPGSGVIAGIAGGMSTAKIVEKTRKRQNS